MQPPQELESTRLSFCVDQYASFQKIQSKNIHHHYWNLSRSIAKSTLLFFIALYTSQCNPPIHNMDGKNRRMRWKINNQLPPPIIGMMIDNPYPLPRKKWEWNSRMTLIDENMYVWKYRYKHIQQSTTTRILM